MIECAYKCRRLDLEIASPAAAGSQRRDETDKPSHALPYQGGERRHISPLIRGDEEGFFS